MDAIKLITFDAGNTLVYAYPSLGEIYAGVTRECGADIPPERFVEVMLPAYREVTQALGDRVDTSDEADRRMWEEITRKIHANVAGLGGVSFDAWFGKLYDRFGCCEAWKTFDDVEVTLRKLGERGVTLGLISNWDIRLRGIAKGLGLLDHFPIVKISSEVGARKPHPLMFEQAQAEAGVAPREALHVGDLLSEDIAGARKAGWHAALIDRTGEHAATDGYRVIRSLVELLG